MTKEEKMKIVRAILKEIEYTIENDIDRTQGDIEAAAIDYVAMAIQAYINRMKRGNTNEPL